MTQKGIVSDGANVADDSIKFNGILKKEKYLTILDHAIPSERRLIDYNFTFMQDNVAKYKVKIFEEYLQGLQNNN